MAPEKCQANRKNVRDNRKKDRIGITPKTPESLYPCGFAGCPRARAQKTRKTRKNQQKTRCLNPACGQLRRCWRAKASAPPPLRGGSPSRKSWPPRGRVGPQIPAYSPRLGRSSTWACRPPPPCGCAPLRGLNGHAGTPLWLGNERVGAGMRRNGHRKPWEPFCGLRGTSGQGWGEKTRCRPF